MLFIIGVCSGICSYKLYQLYKSTKLINVLNKIPQINNQIDGEKKKLEKSLASYMSTNPIEEKPESKSR